MAFFALLLDSQRIVGFVVSAWAADEWRWSSLRFFQYLRKRADEVKKKTTDTFVRGLSRTRSRFSNALLEMIGKHRALDEELYEQLEMMLISADVGFATTQKLLGRLQEKVRQEKVSDSQQIPEMLAELVREMLPSMDSVPLRRAEQGPTVYLFVGVNGVGKTTTIGKLAYRLNQEGDKVMLAAGDTFRAGAIEQLVIWGERAGNIDVVRQTEGADPAAVIYDGTQAAQARGVDVLMCDTAGRLQNKKNLMQELSKIRRVIARIIPDAPQEVLLVLDATTGQNALRQAEEFCEVVEVTGLVLTKLDGTAKGGIVLAIQDTLKIPIKYVGLGERPEDLMPFDADSFVHAMFMDSASPSSSS